MKLPLSRVLDLLLYAGLAALGVMFLSRKLSGPDEGAIAAPIDLPIVGNSDLRFRLAEHRGKAVLVEVFASWCGSCRRAVPVLQEAWEKHRGRGVTFVAVSLDRDPAVAARVKKEWKIPYDVAIDDGSLAKNYGIEVLPTFIVIDEGGVVRHVSTGSPSQSMVDDWLREL